MKNRIFIDMDGVLAYFNKDIECLDSLYQQGYFASLKPINTVIDGVKQLKQQGYDIYILSSVLNSKYALIEKNQWLDKFVPFIDKDKRIFIEYGKDKMLAIKDLKRTDILIDDYTNNLNSWSTKGTGIKLVNDINDSNRSWTGDRIYYNNDPLIIATEIKACIFKCLVREQNIEHTGMFKNLAQRKVDALEKAKGQTKQKNERTIDDIDK